MSMFATTRFGSAHNDVVSAGTAVKSYFILASVRVGKIGGAVIFEERHGNALEPRFQIDAFHLAPYRLVHFFHRFAVR